MTTLGARLSILGLIVLMLSGAPAGQGAEPCQPAGLDRLAYSPGLDFHQARQALAQYEKMLMACPQERVPLLIRLSRLCSILGEIAPRKQRRPYYEQGRTYADLLLQEAPQQAKGHYWKALNLCGLADVGGCLLGLKLLPEIVAELQRAVALDPGYDQAGAHRVLGRIYYEAPGWPMNLGDPKKSLEHLRAAVRLAPENSTNHLYLAETLLRLKEPIRARVQLNEVFQSSRHAVNLRGLEKDRREARRLLAELRKED
jgi:tetratricopeptide (TPR) repeat protein